MSWRVMSRLTLSLALLSWLDTCFAAQQSEPTEARPKPGIIVWDTGRPSEQALAPSNLAGKNDWTTIPLGKTAESFAGDAVVTNGRIAAVLRKQESAVEVYSIKSDGAIARLRLRLETSGGAPAANLERIALVDNTKGGAALEAAYRTPDGVEISGRFRIKRGDISVQIEPLTGAGRLRVECPARFVVLPDFFADDITFDATKLSLTAVELPSENFILHLTGGGDAMAMCVFENRKQDIKVVLAGDGTDRKVAGSAIDFEGKKIWVALMEAPRIWHSVELKPTDTGKIMPLGWKMPYPAQWRVDFNRADNLTDSWEMLLQEVSNGEYTKPSWLGSGSDTIDPRRMRWNTVLGFFPYPCWSDPDRNGYLQPLASKALAFVGPALVYPINRVKETPLDAYTVLDVMRNTLGVGPCQHILDVEGQKSEYRGHATCGVRDILTPIYKTNKQKEKRAEVIDAIDGGLVFVKHIRGRITRYVDFGQKMKAYLAEQKKTHPECANFIAEMEKINEQIDKRVAARVDKIQTPEHVARMNDAFRKNVLDYEGPDAVKRCKEYTSALVEIGDNQDELSAECRWVVKTLRQRAGILVALDPRAAPVASEIRARTQEALRNPANHESARH
jgi:hypothetical protein